MALATGSLALAFSVRVCLNTTLLLFHVAPAAPPVDFVPLFFLSAVASKPSRSLRRPSLRRCPPIRVPRPESGCIPRSSVDSPRRSPPRTHHPPPQCPPTRCAALLRFSCLLTCLTRGVFDLTGWFDTAPSLPIEDKKGQMGGFLHPKSAAAPSDTVRCLPSFSCRRAILTCPQCVTALPS